MTPTTLDVGIDDSLLALGWLVDEKANTLYRDPIEMKGVYRDYVPEFPGDHE